MIFWRPDRWTAVTAALVVLCASHVVGQDATGPPAEIQRLPPPVATEQPLAEALRTETAPGDSVILPSAFAQAGVQSSNAPQSPSDTIQLSAAQGVNVAPPSVGLPYGDSPAGEPLPVPGEVIENVRPEPFLAGPPVNYSPLQFAFPTGMLTTDHPGFFPPGNALWELPGPVPEDGTWAHYGGKARSYYINDQRIEWTGLEATFAVEGVLNGGIHRNVNDWDCMVEGEFFFNQPFDRNILIDSPLRQSFASNYEIPPFEISQLYLAAKSDQFLFQAGRIVTPFGRFYFPLYMNNFSDAPFIRSEAILFRETGLLAQWNPAGFVCTAALTNGGFNQDTNSSKALIARVGIDQPWFACGTSVKLQDGVGSEGQKEFNNHVGMDAMVQSGNWQLSGEVIYDEYGFRRPGYDPNDIFWGRSIYFRDLNRGLMKPLTGVGYYINLNYTRDRLYTMLNFGEFYPNQQLGIVPHDTPVHRGLIKTSYHFTRCFEAYNVLLIENSVPLDIDGRVRKGFEVIAGCQFSL